MVSWIVLPFMSRGRLDVVLLGMFLLMNCMVFVNSYLHNPEKLYDGYGHMAYVKALTVEKRLPTKEESYEFYSPPLPYLLPAFARGVFHLTTTQVAKFGQYLNVAVSLLLTYFLLRLVLLMNPPELDLRRTTLLLLGTLPVYYKTLAMGARGEPYVALFTVISLYFLMNMIHSKSMNLWKFELLGLLLGLAILSRQWGILIFPSIFGALMLMVYLNKERTNLFHGIILTALIATLVGGWFYYGQRSDKAFSQIFNLAWQLDYYSYVREHPDLFEAFERARSNDGALDIRRWGRNHYGKHGRFENRNIKEIGFSLHNQGRDFYLGTGNGKVFTNPTRGAFPNQFFPIYYTEIWGDYWSYFLVIPNDDVNKIRMGSYLGRVNLISIFPTMLMIAGLLFGLSQVRYLFQINDTHRNSLYIAVNSFVVVVSLVGYMWFVIRYPSLGKGDTIKATYLLHMFPSLAILGACLLGQVRKTKPYLSRLSLALLLAISIHNFPAFISHIGDNYKPSRIWLPDLDIPGNYD